MKKLFSSYGKVTAVSLTLGGLHSKNPGSGVVELEGSDVQGVISALDRRLFRGAVLRIRELPDAEPTASPPADVTPDSAPAAARPAPEGVHNAFHVASVEVLSEPEPGYSKDWCRYIIISGASRITGMHRGTVAEVTAYAEDMAEGFNMRSMARRGRSPIWASRNKK
jgi:hypothetical protein